MRQIYSRNCRTCSQSRLWYRYSVLVQVKMHRVWCMFSMHTPLVLRPFSKRKKGMVSAACAFVICYVGMRLGSKFCITELSHCCDEILLYSVHVIDWVPRNYDNK